MTTACALPALDAADLDRAHLVVAGRWERLRGARVFLTGGTGFVGKWLLATLIDADERFGLDSRVTVLSRDPEAFRRAAPQLADAGGVELLKGDVREFVLAAPRFSHVIHAATDVAVSAAPLDVFDTCVTGTRRVLDLAVRAGAGAFLLVSSGAVYGPQPPELPALPETHSGAPDPTQPSAAYGEGKRAAEWLCSAYAAQHGFRLKTARCFALLGPYLPLDSHFAAGNFLRDALAGNPIRVQGDGTAVRSYLHGADMAAWLWAVLLDGNPGSVYNVGGSEAVSIRELAHCIARMAGATVPIEVLGQAAPGAPRQRYVPDVRRATRELGLAEPLSLDEAVGRTLRWHRRSGPP